MSKLDGKVALVTGKLLTFKEHQLSANQNNFQKTKIQKFIGTNVAVAVGTRLLLKCVS
jgi:hypothetical protein